MLRKICVLSSLFFVVVSLAAQDSRHFTFHYSFTVKNLSAGEKVRVWIPAAQSDSYQEVRIISAQGDLPLNKTSESKYGNQIYYTETTSAQPELHFDIEYDVVRRERVALGQNAPHVSRASLTARKAARLAARRSRSCDRIAGRSGGEGYSGQDWIPRQSSRHLRLRLHHAELRQNGLWLGPRRRSLRLRRKEGQLHGLPLSVHCDGPLPRHPSALRNRISTSPRPSLR